MWWYAVMPAQSSGGSTCMYPQSKSAFSRKSFFTPFWIGDMPRPWLWASTRPGMRSCRPLPSTRAPGCLRCKSAKAPTASMRPPCMAIAPSGSTPFSLRRASTSTCRPLMSSVPFIARILAGQQHAPGDAARREEPERIHLEQQDRRGARRRDRPEPPVGRRRRADHPAAGEHEADDERRDRLLDRAPPWRILESLPQIGDPPGEDRRRRAHREERNQRAGEPGDTPADEADDENVGAGRSLRDGEELYELRRRRPAFHFDHQALHLRHHRGHAAEGDQREHAEGEREIGEDHSQSRRAQKTPIAAASGMTMSIDTRPTPTLAKQPAISASPASLRTKAFPILSAVPMKSPAP